MNCKEPSLCVWTLVSPGLNPVGESGAYVCVWGCVSVYAYVSMCAYVCRGHVCISVWIYTWLCMGMYLNIQVHMCLCIGTQMVVFEVYGCVCSVHRCEYA